MIALQDVEKALCEKSLRHFVMGSWSIVEPAKAFIKNWHIDYLSEYLTCVFPRQQITKLVINIPPGCMKSTIVSVCWATWVWTRYPATRIISTSYTGDLSLRDAVKSRRVIESPWYRGLWGEVFKLTGDQNVKSRYENDKTGFRLATSVDGSLTGEHCDIMICDDPHNMQEIHSKKIRESTISWWRQVASTRLNSEKSGRVIIMQREHEDDLSGAMLKEGGWTHIKIPMEYERRQVFRFPISFREHIQENGSLLWNSLFPRSRVDELKRTLGSSGVASQFQQEPVPAEGGIIKSGWWKWFERKPEDRWKLVIQSWDTAFKDGQENDFSSGQTWAIGQAGFYLLDRIKEKLTFPDLKRRIAEWHDKWMPAEVLIEDKASGQSVIQELRRMTHIPIIPVKVDRDKVTRVHAVSPTIESGRIFLPKDAPWTDEYVHEFSMFPNGEHDDEIDATTQAIERLLQNIALTPSIEAL